MIAIEALVKSFKVGDEEARILKGINLQISKGEFVSIMGPSGSGKTTLAAILGCLSSASSGRYELDGIDVSTLKPHQLAAVRNKKIGFVFQDFNLLNELTAWENVALPLVYAGTGYRERKEKSQEALAKVGLSHRLDHRPNQLSGGQKQRVAIARAIVNSPSLLFADEPTGALDANTTQEILELMQTLNALGQTIVQVTHSEDDALHSKRIVRLYDGQIAKDEYVSEFDAGRIVDPDADQNSEKKRIVWSSVAKCSTVGPGIVGKLFESGDDVKSIKTNLAVANALLQQNNIAGIRMLGKLFKSDDWRIRAEIIKKLEVKQNDLALGYFRKATSDSNEWVRYLALRKIFGLDIDMQKICIDEVASKKLMGDVDDRVRSIVMAIIKGWKDPALFDLLKEAVLHDRSGRVRANALEAVVSLVDHHKEFEREKVSFVRLLDDSNHRISSTAAVWLYGDYQVECQAVISRMLESSYFMDVSAAIWATRQLDDPIFVKECLSKVFKRKIDRNIESQLVATIAYAIEKGTVKAEDLLSA